MLLTTLFIILAASCNAAMDILDHRWNNSIFSKLAKHKHSFWSSKKDSHVRKYKNYDTVAQIPAFPLATTILAGFTDSWHMFKELMWQFVSFAVAVNLDYPIYYSFPAIRILIGISFNLFYSTNILKIKNVQN